MSVLSLRPYEAGPLLTANLEMTVCTEQPRKLQSMHLPCIPMMLFLTTMDITNCHKIKLSNCLIIIGTDNYFRHAKITVFFIH